MSVTTPAGFRAAGVTAGLKSSGAPDLALVVNDGPTFDSASVFTSNRCQANPVLWSKEAVKDGVVKMEDIADEPRVFAQMPDDNEYDAFEKYVNELAGELGMTGPQLQANLWMGAGSRTGLHEGSKGTFMDLLKKRADDRAKQLGLKPKFDEATGQYISPRAQVLDEFIRNRGLLEMGGAMGGLGAAAKYATDLPPQEQESPIPRSPVY